MTAYYLTVSRSQASSRLNSLRLLIVIENSFLASYVLNALLMNVVYLNHVVCNICVVLILVCNDALCVQVMSVYLCDNSLVKLCIVIVLSDNCLKIAVVCVYGSVLGWQLHLTKSGQVAGYGRRSPARCVYAWQNG